MRPRFASSALFLVAMSFAAVAPAAEEPSGGCTVEVSPGADVQQALDHASEGTGPVTLCLDTGEFRLPGFLSIRRDHVTVRGQGPSTVLRLEGGVESPVIVVGDHGRRVPAEPTSDVTIERLRIAGGGGRGGETHPAHPYLTNSAVVVRAGRNVRLRELDVSSCRSACLLTEHDTRDVEIESSSVHGSTWDGISLNRTSRARLVRNEIHDNTAAGITAEHLEDSLIEDNTIRDNRSHGVYLSDSYRNRFFRNRFSGNTNAGVFLTCAVRHRDPGPVLCWNDSMSQANTFEDNEFVGNRLGYIVTPDEAANCKKAECVANVSRGDEFVENPSIEQNSPAFGECLRRVDAEAKVAGKAR